jgi:hypothetical protein
VPEDVRHMAEELDIDEALSLSLSLSLSLPEGDANWLAFDS